MSCEFSEASHDAASWAIDSAVGSGSSFSDHSFAGAFMWFFVGTRNAAALIPSPIVQIAAIASQRSGRVSEIGTPRFSGRIIPRINR